MRVIFAGVLVKLLEPPLEEEVNESWDGEADEELTLVGVTKDRGDTIAEGTGVTLFDERNEEG